MVKYKLVLTTSSMASHLAANGIVTPSITINQSSSSSSAMPANPAQRRPRSASLVKVESVGDSLYEVLDQNAYVNPNAEWVNRKGKPSSQDLWHFANN